MRPTLSTAVLDRVAFRQRNLASSRMRPSVPWVKNVSQAVRQVSMRAMSAGAGVLPRCVRKIHA